MSDVGSWNASLGSTAWHPAKRVTPASRRRPMPVARGTQFEIRTLEERLANPGPGESALSLAAMFAEDFREFGSSGRILDAATVLGTFSPVAKGESRAPISLEGFRVEAIEWAGNELRAPMRIRIERRGIRGYECYGCRRRTWRVRDRAERTWDDVPWAEHRVTVVYEQRRVACRTCGIRTERVAFS